MQIQCITAHTRVQHCNVHQYSRAAIYPSAGDNQADCHPGKLHHVRNRTLVQRAICRNYQDRCVVIHCIVICKLLVTITVVPRKQQWLVYTRFHALAYYFIAPLQFGTVQYTGCCRLTIEFELCHLFFASISFRMLSFIVILPTDLVRSVFIGIRAIIGKNTL